MATAHLRRCRFVLSGAYEKVADSMETMLNDGNVVRMIAELKKQDRNLWQKICDWFKNLADDLKATVEAYKGHSPNSAEGRMVAEMQDVIGIFESLYTDALMDASGNYQASGAEKNTAVEDGVRYSLGGRSAQKNITNDYQKTVDSILNGTRRDSSAVLLGYTPDVYQNLGMPSLPFVIGPGHVYSAAKTEAEAKLENRYSKKMHYHGLGDTAVKNIYQAVENPLMIIAAKDVDPKATPMRSTHSVVAIVDVGTNDKHLLLPVEITAKRTVNGEEMDVNVLSSAYTRNVQTLVQEAIALETIGEVGVYYIKKGATLPADSGVQFPVHLSKKAASGGIIHSFAEKVNLNIVDQTQSRQFKRWFGDWQNRPETASKVINVDGTPRVMYHGSPEQFTIFDKRKAKSSGMFGKGFYFTDSASHASTYGNRYEVYLNIRNPLEHGRSTVSRPQVRKFLEAVAENEDYSIENYGTYDVDAVLEKVLGDKSKIDAFQVLQDINATAIGDFVEAVELFNDIAGTSFDGIVAPTETVAFYPEQIKSATDNIGTFDGTNPDIRYSSRDPVAAEVDKALQQENAKLREDVTYLKELLKLQRSVTGGTKFTKTSVEAAAGQLMKAANAKGDRKALAGLLNSFYEYIAKEKELTWEGVSEAAQPAVDWLQKHVDLKPQRSEYAQEILGQLRGSRIYLDESQKAEAAHRYGSFNDFRKSLMGSVTIANDAKTSLDSLWQEMAGGATRRLSNFL